MWFKLIICKARLSKCDFLLLTPAYMHEKKETDQIAACWHRTRAPTPESDQLCMRTITWLAWEMLGYFFFRDNLLICSGKILVKILGMGGGAVPADNGWEVGYILDRLPVPYRDDM